MATWYHLEWTMNSQRPGLFKMFTRWWIDIFNNLLEELENAFIAKQCIFIAWHGLHLPRHSCACDCAPMQCFSSLPIIIIAVICHRPTLHKHVQIFIKGPCLEIREVEYLANWFFQVLCCSIQARDVYILCIVRLYNSFLSRKRIVDHLFNKIKFCVKEMMNLSFSLSLSLSWEAQTLKRSKLQTLNLKYSRCNLF